MIFVDQEEVIEVAAHFLRGPHGCVKVKFRPVREGREVALQHAELDIRRQLQLFIQSVQFRDHGHDAPHRVSRILVFRHRADEGENIFIPAADPAAYRHLYRLLRVFRIVFFHGLFHPGGQQLKLRPAVGSGEHQEFLFLHPDHVVIPVQRVPQNPECGGKVPVRLENQRAAGIVCRRVVKEKRHKCQVVHAGFIIQIPQFIRHGEVKQQRPDGKAQNIRLKRQEELGGHAQPHRQDHGQNPEEADFRGLCVINPDPDQRDQEVDGFQAQEDIIQQARFKLVVLGVGEHGPGQQINEQEEGKHAEGYIIQQIRHGKLLFFSPQPGVHKGAPQQDDQERAPLPQGPGGDCQCMAPGRRLPGRGVADKTQHTGQRESQEKVAEQPQGLVFPPVKKPGQNHQQKRDQKRHRVRVAGHKRGLIECIHDTASSDIGMFISWRRTHTRISVKINTVEEMLWNQRSSASRVASRKKPSSASSLLTR